eukprot:4780964-Karenia_brevis.AAC.1
MAANCRDKEMRSAFNCSQLMFLRSGKAALLTGDSAITDGAGVIDIASSSASAHSVLGGNAVS